MSKRITKAKRAYLLALVRGAICGRCEEHPVLLYTQTCLGCWRMTEREERERREFQHCEPRLPSGCAELCGFEEYRAAGRYTG